MRIHTDNLGHQDIAGAAAKAHVDLIKIEACGSRKRDHAFEVGLSGSSARQSQTRTDFPARAATWDEWGNFIDALFEREPTLIAGPYDGRHDFIDQTQEATARNAAFGDRPDMTAPWLER